MARTKLHVMREPEWSTRQEDMDRPVGPARRPLSPRAAFSSTSMETDATTSKSLPRIVNPIKEDRADFVLGSRIRGRAQPGSLLRSQIIAAHLVGFLVRMLQGVPYTDMGPFRAIRRSRFNQLPMSEMTYGWNLEMQIRAAQYELRILEIPVDYSCRIGGMSKVSGNLGTSIKAAIRIIGVIIRIGLSRHP